MLAEYTISHKKPLNASYDSPERRARFMAKKRCKRIIGPCDVCGERRTLNRYLVCRVCAKANGAASDPVDRTAIYTASHTLSDILPFADKDMDEPRERYRWNK